LFLYHKIGKKKERLIPPPRKNYKNKPQEKDLKSGKNTGIIRPVKGNWTLWNWFQVQFFKIK
jgi:hypothetical protein